MKELTHLLRYLVVWISQNLSIPFWIVGHVHLTMNIYSDLNELLASIGMNLIVAVGFIISYIDERKNKN
jgi:hydrogenase maturation factor